MLETEAGIDGTGTGEIRQASEMAQPAATRVRETRPKTVADRLAETAPREIHEGTHPEDGTTPDQGPPPGAGHASNVRVRDTL